MFTINCRCKSCEYESTGMMTIEMDDPDAVIMRDELLKRYPVEQDNKFAEPETPGVYFTQSGMPLYNEDHGGFHWSRCDGMLWDQPSGMYKASWPVVLGKLAPSEFPLRKAVPE